MKGLIKQVMAVLFLLLVVLNSPVLAQYERSFQPQMNLLRPDAPTRAKLYAGLIAGAALYGLLAPEPDDFRIRFGDFGTSVIPGTNSYRYFVRQREVAPEEFFQTMDDEIARNRRAVDERKRAGARKKSLRGVVFGTYVLMLADLLWLTPRGVENRSVNLRFEGLSYAGSPYRNTGIAVQLYLTLH